jgi:DNA-binding CsgD family transcriptional regulator
MDAHYVDPQVTDLMTVCGIRAAADLVEVSRDHRDHRAVRRARTMLYRLAQRRDRLPGPPFTALVAEDPVLAARRAVRDAEVARFDGHVAPELWAEAARRCASAGLGWEQQVANVRWGASLLAAGASRPELSEPLRAAHRYAVAEGAAGMLRDIEAMATAARLSLEEPVSLPVQQPRRSTPLERLTGREREVLSHLVAGRTYAEIAGALFISEKTVSTHVSNLLRKTGTSSRQQVSALALRLSASGDRAR